ncbi:MAG: helix-turn-helix domain-containing protein [Jatrophihabitantaceae bacterium]
MDEAKLVELAAILQKRREQLGLSAREVARRAGIDVGAVIRLENATKQQPRLETLKALGEVLGIPTADLYVAVDALPAGELPSLRPYMRAKYRDLPDEALAEVESFIDQLGRRHSRGPRDNEDEH